MTDVQPRSPKYICVRCDEDWDGEELFIVTVEPSGVCESCVGYMMSFLAIDNRARFEMYVDKARAYSDNNQAARAERDAAKRLS